MGSHCTMSQSEAREQWDIRRELRHVKGIPFADILG